MSKGLKIFLTLGSCCRNSDPNLKLHLTLGEEGLEPQHGSHPPPPAHRPGVLFSLEPPGGVPRGIFQGGIYFSAPKRVIFLAFFAMFGHFCGKVSGSQPPPPGSPRVWVGGRTPPSLKKRPLTPTWVPQAKGRAADDLFRSIAEAAKSRAADRLRGAVEGAPPPAA